MIAKLEQQRYRVTEYKYTQKIRKKIIVHVTAYNAESGANLSIEDPRGKSLPSDIPISDTLLPLTTSAF